MINRTVNDFMRMYMGNYILDADSVDLLRHVSTLADRLFDFSMNCSQEEFDRDEHVRLLFAYRDLAQYSIDCVLYRAKDCIAWRREQIAQKEAEEKEQENKGE